MCLGCLRNLRLSFCGQLTQIWSLCISYCVRWSLNLWDSWRKCVNLSRYLNTGKILHFDKSQKLLTFLIHDGLSPKNSKQNVLFNTVWLVMHLTITTLCSNVLIKLFYYYYSRWLVLGRHMQVSEAKQSSQRYTGGKDISLTIDILLSILFDWCYNSCTIIIFAINELYSPWLYVPLV